MALMAALESDLRALSAEARRRHPAVKDAAEHAILKLRSLSSPGDKSSNEDILRIFLMACDVRSVKLSVIGLSCLQKLISHDAVAPSALKDILATLKDHSEITDDTIQLKTLQTILVIFQSHLQPENEDNLAKALGICLRFLENNRSSDSVRNTAAATFRQAVALVFDNIVIAESLHSGKFGTGSRMFRSSSVTDDVSRNISNSSSPEKDFLHVGATSLHKSHSKVGKLGLLLLEDLTALAAGGSAIWLRVHSLQRIFSLDILEFVLSNYAVIFRSLIAYEKVLRHQICSLLMTSLRTNSELEGETGEPSFRRLVLRSVAHVIRLYSKSLVTECEVFLNMLLKVTFLDLPLWHRILVLEIIRGFCVEARTLHLLFQIFDMNPKNTNIVENIVKALARVVSTIQILDSSEESLAAVAGMFNSKAKGIEWSMDNDSSNAAVVVASEAHAITLAVEGLLGVVFTIATLTDEAVDLGEIESPKCDTDPPPKCSGETAVLCLSMVDTTWLTILDALSLILTRSQGEAIVLEILKAYQAFTQACGVLHAVEPLNSFLASLCKFTISIPGEPEKKSVLLSPGTKKPELFVDQRESIVLTPKNVQALRTLFNIAHRLHNVLGPSWVLVLETLAALDRAIHSPHASTQEVSTSVPKLTREMSALNSDFNILSSLNSQLFESSALMHISAVKSLLSALHQLSNQCHAGVSSGQQTSSISFSVERMTSILVNNLHRVVSIWNQIVDHLLELADNLNPHLRNLALEALDKSICVVLGSNQFMEVTSPQDQLAISQMENTNGQMRLFECDVLSPLKALYTSSQNLDVRIGTLKILLHVLERHGERLVYSWPEILGLLRSVADAPEKELVPLGFQSVRVIMNDGLSTIPPNCLNVCIDVTGAYSSQKTEINISLTAIGLLWTTTDFIAKGLLPRVSKETEQSIEYEIIDKAGISENKFNAQPPLLKADCCDKLLFSIFSTLQELGADGRPEVRNSAIRTLFQILGSHGHKLSRSMWEDCLWNYVFPILDRVHHLATTSSRDEWQGKELGTRGGKAIHMLIHHSRNTAQKQWDETIVLVLGGITRILRSFFPFLQSLSNFAKGWEELLFFVRDSMLNGSKEVALAAINCLQSVVSSHCPKGHLSRPYLISVLDVYELVFQNTSDYKNSAIKVKQEILHGLGDLYDQANNLFQNEMYIQLLVILHVAICQTKTTFDSVESETGNTSPVQRTVLEILPLLRPADHLTSMWSHFFLGLLGYLPGSKSLLTEEIDAIKQTINVNLSEDYMKSYSEKDVSDHPIAVHVSEPPQEVVSLLKRPAILYLDSQFTVPSDLNTHFGLLFGVKLVPVLVEIFHEAPANAKYNLSAVIIQSLGRCMLTRRDFPDGALWRVAVDGFNRVLSDFLVKPPTDFLELSTRNSVRSRLWKEVADVYEIFLLGSCGRALSSNTLSPEALKADESLEMSILDVLGDKILKADMEAPVDTLCRLVATLDRCAARTGSLPIETVGLMPLHCSRFSLCCLEKIFSACSYSGEDSWHPSRSEVSKISVPILISRCEIIMDQFITDESNLGEHPLPSVRVDEIIFVLQELARLVLHSETASVLQLPLFLKEAIPNDHHLSARAQLLCLFPSLSELVISREARVRELVQVLLRLVSAQLGFQRLGNTI